HGRQPLAERRPLTGRWATAGPVTEGIPAVPSLGGCRKRATLLTMCLVVHPANLGHLWHEADTGAPWRAVPASVAPDKGMLVGIPVGRRPACGGRELLPGREAAALERQGPQDLPPGLDQVQVGGIFGLEDELPTRMGQAEEQHVVGVLHVEVIQ